MSDLISRQAAIDAVTRYCTRYDLRELLADIEVIPATIVEERQRGRWIWGGEWDDGHNKLVRCSVCDAADLQADGVIVPYCWRCGAEMEPGKATEMYEWGQDETN